MMYPHPPETTLLVAKETGRGAVTAHNVELLLRPDRLPGESWLGYRARLRAARDWRKANRSGARRVAESVPEGNIAGKR
jgi:hypothetical protein